MAENTVNQHFLDTSVVRPLLLGSTSYKQYFAEQFGDESLYISKYIQMEIKRSYLCPLIHFYFLLDMPSIQTVGDAFAVWSNRFKTSELKAIVQLVGDLLNTRQLDMSDPRDKDTALRAIGDYVRRLQVKLTGRFKDIGVNASRCARAMVPLDFSRSDSALSEQLREFLEQFEDTKASREQCRIDRFILTRYRAENEAFTKYASRINRNSKENRGFVAIAERLERILENGPEACSCQTCKIIGDSIIALEAPGDMRIEHTDHSFDHLCAIIYQPHYKHPSETSIIQAKTL